MHAAGANIGPLSGGGHPLPATVRNFIEPRFGRDFSDVRVHRDAAAANSADAIGARAFTQGSFIYFGSGQFVPESPAGVKLIAHEIAHVIQGREGRTGSLTGIGPSDHPLEIEAEAAAVRVAAGQPAGLVPRRASVRPPEGVVLRAPYFGDTASFLARFRSELARDLHKEIIDIELTTGSTFASWSGGSPRRFLEKIATLLSAYQGPQLQKELYRILPDVSVEDAFRRGRTVSLTKTGWVGGNDYAPGVALELRSLLAQALVPSLARIMPRYLIAKNQAALLEESRLRRQPETVPEPPAEQVIASSALDLYTVAGLRSGVVNVDFVRYRKANPAERNTHEIQPLRTIADGDWEFEAKRGLWSWISVKKPKDATVEEVSTLLYGDETKSRLIVPAPPLYGFAPMELPKARYEAWTAIIGDPFDDWDIHARLQGVPKPMPGKPESTLYHGFDLDRGPIEEALQSAQGDDMVLAQARALKPTNADRAVIIDRMQVTAKVLDRASEDAKKIHKNFQTVRTRVEERWRALETVIAPQLVYRWDAQSAGQLEVVQRAALGLRNAAIRLSELEKGGPLNEWSGGEFTLRGAIAKHVRNVLEKYVEAVQMSEMAVTGRHRLDEADKAAQRLPFDLAEARIEGMRHLLANAAIDKIHPDTRYTPEELEKSGTAILMRNVDNARRMLVFQRERLEHDPASAITALAESAQPLDILQTGATLIGIHEQIKATIMLILAEMKSSSGFGGVINSGSYKVLTSKMLFFAIRWNRIYARYRAGEYHLRSFKEDLKKLAEDQEWLGLFTSVGNELVDLKKREAWINLGVKLLTLVVIAAATAGVGAFAEGAGLGLFATAGVEAAAFTTLTALTMDEGEQTAGGFFLHLFTNWATFGILKGATALYEAAVGAKFAQSLLGKGVGAATGFATATATMIAQAEIESILRTGNTLNGAQVKMITGQSTALTFAMLLTARYSKPFLAEMRVRGKAFRAEFDAIASARAVNAELAAVVAQSKNIALARELGTADAKVAKLEGEVISKLERDGVKAVDSEGKPLSAEQQVEVARLLDQKAGQPSELSVAARENAEASRAESLVDLESAGPDLFLTETNLPAVKARFEKVGAEVIGPEKNADGSSSIIVDLKDGRPFEVNHRPRDQAGLLMRPADLVAPPAPIAKPIPPGVKGGVPAEPVRPIEKPAVTEAVQQADRRTTEMTAEQMKSSDTRLSPEQRRASLKRHGEALEKRLAHEHEVKTSEAKELDREIASIRTKISRRQALQVKARQVDPGKRVSSQERQVEVARQQKIINRLIDKINPIGVRRNAIASEIARINDGLALARRMKDPKVTETLPCFSGATLVWTESGQRRIDTMAPGDQIICFDEAIGEPRLGTVTEVHRHHTRWLHLVECGAGAVEATGDHRFWVEGAGWKPARDLAAGMHLRGLSAQAVVVRDVIVVKREESTFNLTVEPCPTYFVGDGVLVHNAGSIKFDLGDIAIYEGVNEAFPTEIYIGQSNELKGREGSHHGEARAALNNSWLTPQERHFYEFKLNMKLRIRIEGLDKLTANYFEQVNKDWEASVRGDDKVMNRYEVVAKKNWANIVQQVIDLHCPK